MAKKRAGSTRITELRQRADARLEREAMAVSDLSSEEAGKLVHELRTQQIELEMQNSELRIARDELVDARDRSKELFDFAPVSYVITSDKGLILEANLTMSVMLGVERGSLIAHPLSDYIVEEDEDAYNLHRAALAEPGKQAACDLRLRRSDADRVWVLMESVTAEAVGGEILIRSTLSDISERKRAEALSESELKYTEFFEHSVDAMLIIRDYKFVDCNAATVNMLKYESKEDLLNTHPSELSPEFQPDGRKSYDKAMEMMEIALTRGAHRFEWDHKRQDGEVFPVQVSLTAISQGEETLLHTVWRDNTDRKRAEEALLESRTLYQQLVEGSDDLITRVDEKGRFTYVNHVAERILGVSVTQCVGRSAFDFVHPDDREKTRRSFEECIEGQSTVFSIENRQVNEATGRVSHMLWTSNSRYDERGQVETVNSIARDITERKRAEEERLSLERQVQHSQKLESLGVLAGGIAHDFNNILTVVLCNLELALNDLSNVSRIRPLLEDAEIGARRAADLTRQMLAYSGKGHFVVAPLNMSEMVDEMAHLLASSISKKAKLETRLAANLSAINADAAQMQQIAMNLIVNASESIGEEESGVITVATGVRECDSEFLSRSRLGEEHAEGTYVFIEVTDTGCGMDEETLAKLFDPFFTTKFTGRGLGLSAVLGIVRGHNGAIIVESEVGTGTTFRVLFPALAEKGRQDVATRDNAGRDDWQGTGTVLIVDDEESLRRVAVLILESLGFETLQATDGQDGVAVFRENADKIVCVLLDLTMPRMDGGETFLELRKIRDEVPVVLCSGYDKSDLVDRFDGYSVAGFIQKPYGLSILRETLRGVLGRRTRTRATTSSSESWMM